MLSAFVSGLRRIEDGFPQTPFRGPKGPTRYMSAFVSGLLMERIETDFFMRTKVLKLSFGA